MKWKFGIPHLDDLTIPQRIVLTFVIVIFIIFALFIFGMFTVEGQTVVAEPPPSKWDADLNRLTHEALDEAYRNQLEHVFAIWMKDNAHQPQRAINGARQARHAYIAVMTEIEKRRQ